ncbi:NUDIX domain-containing protein [Desertimonas flava]|uniref:NUDIX domain-containing protein n=1 Tax=Desertimonas flava TaxID=2064846 RepID=UPI000E355EBE|nr:NUDIX domain-containing protein [Desertimonas flava]
MASRHFRAGIVAVVRRSDGAICAFERADAPGSWQLPQGGIEPGEEPTDTAWRELKEETGLTASDVELVAEYGEWVAYVWPERVAAGRKGMGQVQRWFTFRLVDDGVEPTPDGSEFTAWRWVDEAWLIDNVVAFRRPAYERVLGAASS